MLVRFGCFLLVFAAAVDSVVSQSHQDQSSVGAFGYELLEDHLDRLELKLQNTSVEQNTLLEKIVNSLNTLQQQSSVTAQFISQLLDRQTKLQKRLIESCEEATTTGRYRLQLSKNGSAPLTVVCDTEVHDGGWLVIQQRLDGSVDFNRSWAEYRDGFGDVGSNNEFWLGLEAIHQLTKAGDHELLVELKNETGLYGYARYRQLQIAGEDQEYKLSSLSEYSGTIGDGMNYNINNKFSTYDRDNDSWGDDNCAQYHGSGWWFSGCSLMYLNGPYKKNDKTELGIYWHGWTSAATYNRMLIRRRNT